MRINYTSLNKACLKDEYPLPHICQIMDSMASCELLSFLNTYSRYHQISLAIDEEEKTTFITLFGIFYYTKMTLGLKNGGGTYQKCVHIVLEAQIGRNVEAYIDDIVVKLKKQGDLLDDLKETFDNLRKYKIMLNPKNACLVYHQKNCSTIWYRPGESMRTQSRWRPSNNYSHLGLEKKSRTGRHDVSSQPVHI
jgi:hypothetical protein